MECFFVPNAFAYHLYIYFANGHTRSTWKFLPGTGIESKPRQCWAEGLNSDLHSNPRHSSRMLNLLHHLGNTYIS